MYQILKKGIWYVGYAVKYRWTINMPNQGNIGFWQQVAMQQQAMTNSYTSGVGSLGGAGAGLFGNQQGLGQSQMAQQGFTHQTTFSWPPSSFLELVEKFLQHNMMLGINITEIVVSDEAFYKIANNLSISNLGTFIKIATAKGNITIIPESQRYSNINMDAYLEDVEPCKI